MGMQLDLDPKFSSFSIEPASNNTAYPLCSIIVIAHERIEGTQLHPTRTQLIRRVQSKAADVRSGQGNPEHVETKNG